MKRLFQILRRWTLLVSMVLGALAWTLFRLCPVLAPFREGVKEAGHVCIPSLLFLTLFFTFCKVDIRALRPRRWHVKLILTQTIASLVVVGCMLAIPNLAHNLTMESLLMMAICPTAAAAAVVAGKLGGNETSLTTYTIISNVCAAILIPLLFPLVEPANQGGFWLQVLAILKKVFPLLILPLLCATAVRYGSARLLRFILKYFHQSAFYLWAVNLMVLVGITIGSVASSPETLGEKLWLAFASMVMCLIGFFLGKWFGRRDGEVVSAGQALGQKNTVFAIWVTLVYLQPAVAIAPACYIIWQNLFNSWQIGRYERQKRRAAVRT